MNDFRQYSELYHHGIKGMRWGVRRYQNPDGSLTVTGKLHYAKEKTLDTVGEFLGKETEGFNKVTNTSGKLRKTYFEMHRAGVKYKDGKYVYTNKKVDADKNKKQKVLVQKAKRQVDAYLKKYGNMPMSYVQNLNAQKGAVVGAVVAAFLPAVGGWMTIPAGYVLGSKMGKRKKKIRSEKKL